MDKLAVFIEPLVYRISELKKFYRFFAQLRTHEVPFGNCGSALDFMAAFPLTGGFSVAAFKTLTK